MQPAIDPVAILPLDVLFDAFQYFKPNLFLPQSSTPEILSLCHVSRSWRAAAFSFPLLWDCIALHLPHYKGDVVAELLQEWMGRSRKCRLFISLYYPERYDLQLIEHTRAVLQVLLKQSARWYNVAFRLPPVVPNLFNNGSYNFPILDSMRFEVLQSGAYHNEEPIKLLRINNAPNLRVLQVAGVRLALDGKAFPHLTHFKSSSANVCLEKVLPRTPNLTHLEFQGHERVDLAAYHPHRNDDLLASLPHLQDIKMKTGCRELQIIHNTPSLRSIQIKGTGPPSSQDIQPLLQFMERNTFQYLHTLILAFHFPHDLDTLYRILDMADSVVTFLFNASEFPTFPEFLDPMAVKAGAGRMPKVILPNLECFYVKPSKSGLEFNSLINTIKHRWNGCDRLVDSRSSTVSQSNPGWRKLRSIHLGLQDGSVKALLLDEIRVEIAEGLEVLPNRCSPLF